MLYEDCLRDLYSLVDYERLTEYPSRFNLSSVRAFLSDIGSPQDSLSKPIIITGTKGKGSTAEILASCLRVSGRSVGVYTSPHLVNVRERVKVDGRKITEEEFSSIYSRVRPFIRKEPGGYRTVFEVLTAIAFVHFGIKKTDYSLLEVGMGGANDATNVAEPVLAVVTPISLDHTHVLGRSVRTITKKKMGVARTGIPVVCATQCKEALDVIKARCKELRADLRVVGGDVEYRILESDLEGSRFIIDGKEFSIPLLGEHQVVNAATAYLAVKTLCEDTKGEGFSRVKLEGRMQIVGREPLTILDAAHNAHSAAVLAESVRQLFVGRKVTGVISMLKKKDHQGFARELSPVLDRVYVTRVDSPRSLSPSELSGHFRGLVETIEEVQDAEEALKRARSEAGPGGLVLVTGSFYLVGHILTRSEAALENG